MGGRPLAHLHLQRDGVLSLGPHVLGDDLGLVEALRLVVALDAP